MDQIATAMPLGPAALAGTVIAYLVAATRLAGPLAPVWTALALKRPWVQVIPSVIALLPQVADFFVDVNTWVDLWVGVASAIGLLLPGFILKSQAGGGGGTINAKLAFDDRTPPSLPGARMRMVALLAVLLALPACASWKQVVRTSNDAARILCGEFFSEKQGLSFEDAAKKFCETRDDLAPWIDSVRAAKQQAAPKALELHPPAK